MSNNFFNNLYFFSKLTTSFILLIILVFFGFLFYKAYDFNDNESTLDLKINNLSDKIENLNNELNQINLMITDNQKLLNASDRNIKDNNLNEDFLLSISELTLKGFGVKSQKVYQEIYINGMLANTKTVLKNSVIVPGYRTR